MLRNEIVLVRFEHEDGKNVAIEGGIITSITSLLLLRLGALIWSLLKKALNSSYLDQIS